MLRRGKIQIFGFGVLSLVYETAFFVLPATLCLVSTSCDADWLNPFPAQQSLPFLGFLRIRQALITLDGQDLRGNASSRHRKPLLLLLRKSLPAECACPHKPNMNKRSATATWAHSQTFTGLSFPSGCRLVPIATPARRWPAVSLPSCWA